MTQASSPSALSSTSASFEGQELRGGRYRIEKKINQGGSAWLFKAYHQTLQQPMALKILYPQYLDNEVLRHRFLEEARIQFRLRHQNIVHITDLIDEEFCLGIVMEWCEGEDLRTYMWRQQRALSFEEIEGLLLPIIGAIDFVHRAGLVHRDLKPANILLARNGDHWTPKLTDFGIAKVLCEEGHTVTGSTIGTVTYMAPEQINDSKQVTASADIYSLGVLLYQAVTGVVPFDGPPQKQMIAHLSQTPRPPISINPKLPTSLNTLILSCLEKEPSRRPASSEILLTSLLDILGKNYVNTSLRMPSIPPPKPDPPSAIENSEPGGGLHTDLELLLDQVIEDDLPTTLAQSPKLGPPPPLQSTPTPPSKHEQPKRDTPPPVLPSHIGIHEDKEAHNKMPHSLPRIPIIRERSSRLQTSTHTPSSKTTRPMNQNGSLPLGKTGSHRKPSPQPPQRTRKYILFAAIITIVVIFIGLKFSKKNEQPSLSQALPIDNRLSVIPRPTAPKTPGKHYKVCFHISPKDTFFFFKIGAKKYTQRNTFCAWISKPTKALLWRNGYHDCEFFLPARNQTYDLNIKGANEEIAANASNYCIER